MKNKREARSVPNDNENENWAARGEGMRGG